MAEVWFYHLERRPLEAVLPSLLERSLERGWRVVVEVTTPERADALDAHLWTFSDESFLPHGTDREPNAAGQPILITTSAANPNGAALRVLADGAEPGDLTGLERAVVIFDGNDSSALETARAQWKRLKAAGTGLVYWQQDDTGRWVKKA